MPLVNLATNLKSLKFGNDQPGGGSSNQPYVVTGIPDTLNNNISVDGSVSVNSNVDASVNFTNDIDITSAAIKGGKIGAIAGAVVGLLPGALGGAILGAGIGAGIEIATNTNIDISANPDINANLNVFIPSTGTGGPDFVIRGGQLVFKRISNDATRLTKYFVDTKSWRGIGFAIKQNILSRTAVNTQTSDGRLTFNEGLYSPINTIVQAGINAFGYHVPKQGLNPFREIGAYATNNDNLYAVKIGKERLDNLNPPRQNRLYDLYAVKIVNIEDSKNDKFIKDNRIASDFNEILRYPGGPDSFLGIGKTSIRFADQRTGINNLTNPSGLYTEDINDGLSIIYSADYQLFTNPNRVSINGNRLLGISKRSLGNTLLSDPQFTGFITTGPDSTGGGIDGQYRNVGSLGIPDSVATQVGSAALTTDEGYFTYTQADIENAYSLGAPFTGNINGIKSNLQDFRAVLRKKLFTNPTIEDKADIIGNLSNAPSYDTENIEKRFGLGDPGNNSLKHLQSYVTGAGVIDNKYFGAASYNSYDKITAFPIYPDTASLPPPDNDLVRFRIKTNNKVIAFRAFLDQISDQYVADWEATQYIGRGEKFYTYRGFDRKVSLSWTVAAQSKVELIPMYKKLNFLASICAPKYMGSGYMAGNIAYLTIGDYFNDQPGIITGLTYEMNDENATWEIAISDNDLNPLDPTVGQLPHLIKVTGFQFIPIHTFVPRLQTVTTANVSRYSLDSPNIDPNLYGTERYISLNNGLYS